MLTSVVRGFYGEANAVVTVLNTCEQTHNGWCSAHVAVNVVWALKGVLGELAEVPEPEPTSVERRAGLSHDDGGLCEQIPFTEFYRICQRALSASSDAALGLHWAETASGASLNLLPHALQHAETLLQAFELMVRFSSLLSEQPSLRLASQGNYVALICSPFSDAPQPVQQMMTELRLAGVCRLARAYGPGVQPLRVMFNYGAPTYREEYRRVFGGVERFGRAFSGVLFRRNQLSVRPARRDPALFEVVHALAERRLKGIKARTSCTRRVRDFLLKFPAPHRVSMDLTAQTLATSVRSLHRRLAAEGSSYSELTLEATVAVARRLIVEERYSIKEAAFMMEFADVNSFHRAFKRWTGITPGAYRRLLNGAEEQLPVNLHPVQLLSGRGEGPHKPD